jgi:RNA polymerase sigma-70 factor, ECF subfamily
VLQIRLISTIISRPGRILLPVVGKLVHRVTDSDFRQVFSGHKNTVYRFALRMLGSEQDAEDVAQEVFLALWRNPRAYDSERGAMRSFLLGITRNLVLKRWRSCRPAEELDADMLACAPVDLLTQERAEAIAAAVARLPLLQREAVVLAEYEDLPIAEIAAVTNADLAAVKSRLHRARQNLKRMLAGLIEKKGVLHDSR